MIIRFFLKKDPLIVNSGDSYTDTGFDINGVQPSSVDALGNPPYGTSNGPTCKFLIIR